MLALGQRISAVQSMINNINTDKIYLYTVSINGRETHYATVIVNNETEIEIEENMIKGYRQLEGHKGLLFTIYRTEELLWEINNGNLFLLSVCSPSNLIYSDLHSSILLPLSDLKTEMRAKAIVRFRSGIEKVNSFIRGASFYHQSGERGLSTFMLHQAAEITYRTIGRSLLGKERRSHLLHMHQNWLSNAIPHMPIAFDDQQEEENDLLQLLNLSYSSVRYETNFSIDETRLLLFFNRIQYLIESSITLAEDLIGISNTYTTTKIMTIPVEGFTFAKANYYTRMNRAKALITAGESLLQAKQKEISTTLFAQCISQVCMAIIGLYSGGYEAENLLLPDLLDLCRSHWPDHYLQVQRDEPKNHALYLLLFKSEHPYKHDSSLNIKCEEMLAIHQLCKDFLYEAGIAGIKKLDDLEPHKP